MDDGTVIAVFALIGAFAIALIVPFVVRAPGRRLRRQFVALGNVKGKTRRQIVKVVGPPAQETALPDGRLLLQWRTTGYHIALVFEKTGHCAGVTHENGIRVVGRRPPG